MYISTGIAPSRWNGTLLRLTGFRAALSDGMGIHENLQPVTWAVSMPFVVVTALSCILRVYSRVCLSGAFGADDWFMVAASITWLANQAILGQMIVFGGGKQDQDVPPENLVKILTLLFVIELVYIICQWLIKMSFLTFYLRVLSISPAYKLAIYLVIIFTSMQTLAILLFYGFQCLPLDAFFHPEQYPDAKCIPTPITLYFPAGMNVLTDILIYILPILPLWTLQMSARRRIGLIACFTVGGTTIIVSSLRFIVLAQLASGSRTFYVYGSVAIVTTIELCTAIITANMPSLRSVWRTHVSGTLYGSSARKSSSPYELGTTSQVRGRKVPKVGIVQRLKGGGGVGVSRVGSEEELCRIGGSASQPGGVEAGAGNGNGHAGGCAGGDIIVSTRVNVSAAEAAVGSPRLPASYFKLS